MRGKKAKELRRKAFGEQEVSGGRRYSVKIADKLFRTAKRTSDGKIILDKTPQRLNKGARKLYLDSKRAVKRRRSNGYSGKT